MSCLKDFFRGYAAKENFNTVSKNAGGGDHEYAMANSESSSEEDNTDFEGEV